MIFLGKNNHDMILKKKKSLDGFTKIMVFKNQNIFIIWFQIIFPVMMKRLSPQVEVKSRKTKENRISHIQENGSHSS